METTQVSDAMPPSIMTIAQLLTRIERETKSLVREGLAYDRLYKSYVAVSKIRTGEVSSAVLPIFTWVASSNGEQVNLVTDLQHVPADALESVLRPLCELHLREMVKTAGVLTGLTEHMVSQFTQG